MPWRSVDAAGRLRHPFRMNQDGAGFRLFVDVTDTLARGGMTGIQRVVRQFVRWLPIEARGTGIDVRFVCAVEGRFVLVDPAGVARLTIVPEAQGAEPSPGQGRATALVQRLLERFPPALAAVQQWNYDRRSGRTLAPFVLPDAPDWRGSDVVLLLDSHWGGATSVRAAERARDAGARVVVVIYDLIPVLHPRLALRIMALTFGPRIRRALRVAAGCLTISRTCAAEVRDFLGGERPALPIRHFYLGNDASRTTGTKHPDAVGKPIRDYLMIGSIEPHKGHDTVLDAFDRRWARGERCALTIVGRKSSADPGLARRMEEHPRRGTLLTLVHDASDDRLAGIMDAADAIIMASRAEGFGLPIVEALKAGMPVIASDIAIFREVGGDSLQYFRCGDADGLVEAMRGMEADPGAARRGAGGFSWIGWRESARQALDALIDVLAVEAAGR